MGDHGTLPTVRPGAFVGRGRELDRFRAAADAVRRHGGVDAVAVVGDAGVGTSRFVREAVTRLAADGWRVALGVCPPPDAAPPASGWAQVVRALTRRHDPGELGEALAPLLRDDAPPGRDGTAGDDRPGLPRAVRGLLARLAAHTPVAVVLDDLHEADALTGDLVCALLGEDRNGSAGPVLLVAVHRTPATGELLARLDATVRTRIALPGLTAEEATALVEPVVGADAPRAVLETVVRRSGGHPLHLLELARLHAEAPAEVRPDRLPHDLGEVVRRRVARLGETAARVLHVAALIGRECDLAVLVAALRADAVRRADVLAAVAAAVAAGILETPVPGTLRFAHGLHHEALADEVRGVHRAELHRAIATAVRVVSPDDVERRAVHLLAAGGVGGAREAVVVSRRAAERALARHDPERAAEHYARALAALGRAAPEDDVERADLLARLGRARHAAGAGTAAAAARREAVRLAVRVGDDRLLVGVLVAWDLPTLGTTPLDPPVDHELVLVLERVLRRPDVPAASRCHVACRLVLETVGRSPGRAAAAADLAASAAGEADEADGTGGPHPAGLAAYARALVFLHDGDLTGRLSVARTLVALGDRPGGARFALVGWECRAQHAAVHGDVAALREAVETMAALTSLYRWRRAAGTVAMLRGLLAHLRGDLEAAAGRFRQGTAILTGAGEPGAARTGVIAALCVALTRGRAADLLDLVRGPDPLPPVAADLAALGWHAAGETGTARRVRRSGGPLPHDAHRSLLAAARARALARTGDPADAADRAAARQVYDQLAPFAGQVAGAATGLFALGPVDTARGDLAVFLGRRAAAAGHYETAARLARRVGSAPWTDEVAERRRALSGAGAGVTLTPREAEVLDLLPSLLTVADIARRLGVSAHTVRHHLKGLYRKLEVGNRRAAVDRAVAQGLLDAASVRLALSRVGARQG